MELEERLPLDDIRPVSSLFPERRRQLEFRGTLRGSFSHTFNSAGTFAYYCNVHGITMTGTIIVSN